MPELTFLFIYLLAGPMTYFVAFIAYSHQVLFNHYNVKDQLWAC